MVADSERGHPGPIEWLVVLWSCGEHGEVDVFTVKLFAAFSFVLSDNLFEQLQVNLDGI